MTSYVNHILGQTPSPELYSSFDSNLQLDGYYAPLVSQGQYNTQTGELVSSPKKFGSSAYKSPYGAVNTLRYAAFTNTADSTPNYLYFDAWIYIDGLQYGDYEIFSLCNGATDQNYKSAFGVTAARKVFFNTRPANSTSLHLFSGNTTMNAFQWYHIAVKYENLKKTLYVNGVKDGEYSYGSATGLESFLWTPQLSGGGVVLDVISAHIGTSSADLPSDAQILTRAQYAEPVNITTTTTPATASALLTDETVTTTKSVNYSVSSIITTALMTTPTVIIVNYDTTQVWTGVTANALMVNPSVFVQTNISNSATPMTATADAEQHTIITGTGFNDFVDPFLSSAEFVYPAYAGSPDQNVLADPMIATNGLIAGTINNPPNYRHLVKKYTPSLFITNPIDVAPNDPAEEAYDFINDGYDNWGDESVGNTSPLLRPTNAPAPMLAIGNGKAIYSFSSSGDDTITLDQAAALTQSQYFHTVGNNWTIEYWFYPTAYIPSLTFVDIGYVDFGVRADADQDGLYLGIDRFGNPTNHMSYRAKSGLYINIGGKNVLYNTSGQRYTLYQDPVGSTADSVNESNALAAALAAPQMYQANQWNHLVARASWAGTTLSISFFSNNVFIGTASATVTQQNIIDAGGTSGATTLTLRSGSGQSVSQYRYLTNFAIYKNLLSNAAINEHYLHITEASPNRIIAPASFVATTADFVNPAFVVQDNNNYPATPITANAELVNPVVIGQINTNQTIIYTSANAQFVEPYFYGNPDAIISPDPMTASADIPPNVYRLDTAYYSYVQSNIAPFRYVTFDVPNSNLDWGSDNDFGGAAPFTYGGSISLSIDGLSNNSLLTNGGAYTSSGLIMKESEHDDDWGTSAKNWHTSFWIKKDHTDTNPNGLRIIANLHSYENNKHLIVYQYNNYLYLQLDDKVNTPQTIQSSVNVNVFDGNKHHIVITSKSDDKIQIYKNKILVLDSAVTPHIVTTNSTAYWAPNTETNNKPRFAIGALITPYAETNLPAIPTPSIMYIDEAHWAVTHINQTQVNNLYSAMPFRVDIEFFADVALSNFSDLVNPTFGTGVGNNVLVSEATNAELLNPTLTVDFDKVITVNAMAAHTAELIYPFSVIADNITHIEVFSDILIATAEILPATFILTINAAPMIANARMVVQDPYIDPYHLLVIQQSRLPLSTSYYGTWGIGDIDS